MTDVTAISTTATRHIHLYRPPRVQPPGVKFDPARQRSQIGMAKATKGPRPRTDPPALKATGTGAPPMSTFTRAGAVIRTATTAEAITPYTGTRFRLRRDQYFAP